MTLPKDVLDGRHPGTVHIARYFDARHLPVGPLRDTSMACAALAEEMVATLPDGPS